MEGVPFCVVSVGEIWASMSLQGVGGSEERLQGLRRKKSYELNPNPEKRKPSKISLVAGKSDLTPLQAC